MSEIMNVAESYPLYDTVIVSGALYGKEQQINGWFTTFAAFAANEKHTFFKNRTIGNSHLAYCNMDSADNLDFAFTAFSLGVRFFAPVAVDERNVVQESPALANENVTPWWLFDMPKHCGVDFRVQQDVLVENTCLATPPGYGPRLGSGTQSDYDHALAPPENIMEWKTVTGTNGVPSIENRFPFPIPVRIPRNTSIEVNIYPSLYAREICAAMVGPRFWVMLTEEQADVPVSSDYFSVYNRFGIQVSLYGYRQVQQRGQYHAPGALQPQ